MPLIPYSGRDFDQLKAAMLAQVPALAPAWTNLNEGDLGIALINLVAGVGDMMSFYLDRMSDEVYLTTVLQRSNMKRLAALVDYQLARPVAATTTLRFTLPTPAVSNLLIPKYTQVKTNDGVPFVTRVDATIFAGQTSVDVTGYQGDYQLDAFTGTGQDTQNFALTRANVAQNFLDVLVGNTLWTEDAAGVATTLSAVYRVQTDDNENGSLLFSSFLGSVPTQNTPILAHTIETTGAAGNIGSGLVTKVVSVIPGATGLTVTNTTIATGGRDRESVEEARIKAPRALRRLGRVVTLPDYVDAIEGFDGAATAQAINHNGYAECYVAPTGGGMLYAPAPSIALAALAGGTLAAGTYKVAVTAKDVYGESSTQEFNPADRTVLDRTQSIVVTLNQQITVTITNVTGATAYNVYVSNDGGVTWRLSGTAALTAGATTTTAITALPGSAPVALPTVNTTGVRSDDGVLSLKQAIETYLDGARALCTVFAVFNPTYVPVTVTAAVRIFDNYLQVDRQGAVQTALIAYFTAGQREFGEAVTLSELYAVIMGVEGVRSVSFTSPVGDVAVANGQIGSLGTVTLTMTGGI